MNPADLAIAYSCDDRYAQHAGISLLSLLKNNPWLAGAQVYIVDGGISAENKTRLQSIGNDYGVQLIFLPLGNLTTGLKEGLSFSRNSYARLFLPDAVEADVLWFIDGDTVIAGDFSPLAEIDMSGHLLAGVQDTVNPYFSKAVGLEPAQKYINAGGVIVLNCRLWRTEGLSRKCIEYIDSCNGNPPFDDQGVLNHVCRDRTKVLPVSYNLMPPLFKFDAGQIRDLFRLSGFYSQQDIDEALGSPRLIHFTAEFFNRPWLSSCTHPLKGLYLEYKEKSPWRDQSLEKGRLSRNCRIQNFVYDHLPFFAYKAMIRLIELRHRLRQ